MEKVIFKEKRQKNIFFPEYEVTYDRITERLTKVFTPPQLKEYLNLFDKARKNPKEAKVQVENFQQNYPDLPEIYNLLSYIYVNLKKVRKVEKLTKENYQKNPDYLFAKINYADLCLRKNRPFEIPKIFDEKTQLKDLYPHRKTFHYSEVLGFMCLMSFYFLQIGEKEKALAYYEYVKEIDPDDPTVLLLNQKIHKKNFIQKMLKLLKK